jgi:restriction system protein
MMKSPANKKWLLRAIDFELEVKSLLQSAIGAGLIFTVKHREVLDGFDGTYEIDLTVRFTALNVDFITLVECKKHKYAIKRETVQILNDKIKSTGAHKGILFSTSGFQKGAIDYAVLHGIALVEVKPSQLKWFTRTTNDLQDIPSWLNLPPVSCWAVALSNDNATSKPFLLTSDVQPLRDYLQI